MKRLLLMLGMLCVQVVTFEDEMQLGDCIIVGDCAANPQLLHHYNDIAGRKTHKSNHGPNRCMHRAADFHSSCGNHPEEAIQAIFQPWVDGADGYGTSKDRAGTFPPITSEQAGSQECLESYQVAVGSSWVVSWELNTDGTLKALNGTAGNSNLKVFVCSDTLGFGDELRIKWLLFGHVEYSSESGSVVGCKDAATQGFWVVGSINGVTCQREGVPESLRVRGCCRSSRNRFTRFKTLEFSVCERSCDFSSAISDYQSVELAQAQGLQAEYSEGLRRIVGAIQGGRTGGFLRFQSGLKTERLKFLSKESASICGDYVFCAFEGPDTLGLGAADSASLLPYDLMTRIWSQNTDDLARFLIMLRQLPVSLVLLPACFPEDLSYLLFGQAPTARFGAQELSGLELDPRDAAAEIILRIRGQSNWFSGFVVVSGLGGGRDPVLISALLDQIEETTSDQGIFFLDISDLLSLLSVGPTGPPAACQSRQDHVLSMEVLQLSPTLLLSLVSQGMQARQEVKILVTTALVKGEGDRHNRTLLYQNSFLDLALRGYPSPFIVEALHAFHGGGGTSFLDRLGRVLYTNVNDYHNQGINEFRSIAAALDHFKLQEAGLVVKLTGRYNFVSSSFLGIVEENRHLDLIFMRDRANDMFTGCFAIRPSLLRQAIKILDWTKLELRWINIETALPEAIHRLCNTGQIPSRPSKQGYREFTDCKVLELSRLGVAANYETAAVRVW